jgi:HAD superfamily hydrolase (TIGR01509 family)
LTEIISQPLKLFYFGELIMKFANTCQLVIFDMNGTLVDDAKYQREAWQTLCARLGRELTDEEYKLHVAGHERGDILAYLFGRDLSREQAELYVKEKQKIYEEALGPVITEVPGLTNFLVELTEHNVPLILATSASQSTIDFIIGNLNIRHFFKEVVRTSQVVKGKPAPDLFLRAAEIVGATPSCCVVFEDSLAGLQSAKNAGMKCVGITTSLRTEELVAAGADLSINNYTEINFETLRCLFNK